MTQFSSPAEKHMAKVVIFFVSITGLFFTLSEWLSSEGYKGFVLAGSIFLTMTITWFGRDYVFHKLLMNVPFLNPKNKINNGTWNIHIEFDDYDGMGKKERTGSITMSSSLLGVKINGGKLLNAKDNKTTMNGWYSESAEIVTYEGHDILYYLYKVPMIDKNKMNGDQIKFEKIGFVCASRQKDTDIFEGYFRDIRVISGLNHVREGIIKITYNS